MGMNVLELLVKTQDLQVLAEIKAYKFRHNLLVPYYHVHGVFYYSIANCIACTSSVTDHCASPLDK